MGINSNLEIVFTSIRSFSRNKIKEIIKGIFPYYEEILKILRNAMGIA